MTERGVPDLKRLQRFFREEENDPNLQCGEIYSYTIPNPKYPIYPDGYKEYAPYALALMSFPNGKMVVAQLTDLGDEPPEFGMKV